VKLVFCIEKAGSPIIVMGPIDTATPVRIREVVQESMLRLLLPLIIPYEPPDNN